MPSTLTMLRNATPALSALVLLLVTACGAPNASFYNRGPESLLDVSSEVVNLSVRDQSDLAALTAWIEKDHPHARGLAMRWQPQAVPKRRQNS